MPLLNIYNHLIQGHVMMRQSRFDAHKKSELRDIYQSIMRMTSEQPFYKITFDAPAQTYTLGIKDYALSLSSSLKELHIDDDTSVFRRKTLISDRPDDVSFSVFDGADMSSIPTPLHVSVDSLSSPQKNSGNFVNADARDLTEGQYNFIVGIEQKRYSFQFNVSRGSSNLELQTKLSDFINKTAVGLRTRVVHQKEDGLSRMELLAIQPGTDTSGEPAFTLTDTKRPSDAEKGIISYFGLDNIEVPPVNTVFSVNGRQYETRDKNYVYGNNLSLSFHRTTKEPVTISTVTDKEPVVHKINDFLDSYNSMLSFIKSKNAGNHRASKLLFELRSVTARYSDELQRHGILPNPDGSFALNRDVAYPAAQDGRLEQFFDEEEGFVSSMLHKLSDISLNPMEYLDRTVITYPNTAARKSFRPYVSSIYSGLLYNNYC